jgi:hypothetical protein
MGQLIKSGLVLFSVSFLFLSGALAQKNQADFNLRWNLSDDKTSYAGMEMLNQVWARYVWNNPDYSGTDQYPDIDLGIRRSQFAFYASLNDKVLIYSRMGFNEQVYHAENNPAFTLFDALTEYKLIDDKLHLGFGLHSWNGVSRYSNSNRAQFLVVDRPGFAYPLNGTFSRYGRQMGIYARGNLGKLNYRMSVTKPFEAGTDSISSPFTTERANENFAVKGYFSWQFFDKENSMFPYFTMNNLGRKKILNVGAGFYYHPEAMLVEAEKDLSTVDEMLAAWLIATGNEDLLPLYATGYYPSQISDVFLASADVFADLPLQNNGAFTTYFSYSYYFFGPNYLRSMSTMNVSRLSANESLLQGAGSSQWEVGTGHIVRGEWGYLFPHVILQSRIQPYGAVTWKNFEALNGGSLQFDVGANFLMHAQNIKWTLQYSSRPVYQNIDNINIFRENSGQLILQTQVSF